MIKKRTILIEDLAKNIKVAVHGKTDATYVVFLANGQDMEGEVKIYLHGSKTRVKILGIVIGYGNQKINLHTEQLHIEGGSESNLLVKSVLFDEAKFYYHGLIRIEKGAQKSEAYQKNKNMLMSDGVLVESRPHLEILANDVCCKHGMTAGRIDQNQLYYLLTRGIPEAEAQSMLIRGFLDEVLMQIPDENLERAIECKTELIINNLLEGRKNL